MVRRIRSCATCCCRFVSEANNSLCSTCKAIEKITKTTATTTATLENSNEEASFEPSLKRVKVTASGDFISPTSVIDLCDDDFPDDDNHSSSSPNDADDSSSKAAGNEGGDDFHCIEIVDDGDEDEEDMEPQGKEGKETNVMEDVQNQIQLAKSAHRFSAQVRSKSSPIKQEEVQHVLQKVFGLKKLRNLQPQVVECTLKRNSQLLVLATGGGKSLCYQLPACLLGGITIVISPLIALMVDQVQSLKARNIPAACVCSSQTESENKAVLQQVLDPTKNPLTLLYITPESIQTDRMRSILKQLYKESRLALFAVDEAHCLSSWGHDFRPAYRKLSYLRNQFPKVPCMACTATATPQVIQDIQTILQLQDAPLHKGSFDRPNVFYQVKYKDALDNPLGDLVKYIQKRHSDQSSSSSKCSGIVYVHKRTDTTIIANAINRGAGIRAKPYHAGLKDAQRSQIQHAWSTNKVQVVVATVAFGMGIDLAHVRYVIHWMLPQTVEGFYQESGRAGRDGLPSDSVLYYSSEDVRNFKWLIRSSKNKKDCKTNVEQKLQSLEKMAQYCMTPACRRNALIRHFGGTPVDCPGTCDHCKDPKNVERAIQSAAVLKDVKQTVPKKKGRGKGRKRGRGKGRSRRGVGSGSG